MRRKYFIRGLGLGIIITAVIFIIAMMFNQGTMSDAQIIAKAKELGMVMPDKTMNETKNENKTDSNSAPKTEVEKLQESLNEEETNTAGAEGAENTDPESVLDQGTTTTETLTGDDVTPPPTSANTTSPQAEANRAEQEIKDAQNNSNTTVTNGTTVNSANIVKFQIKSGENSAKVAENLKKAGLITDARAFDTYLEQNGYDMNLRVGTFDIRTGSNNETIAKTLTGR